MSNNQPTFEKPRWRVINGKVERMGMLEHLARCDGTGETFYLCRGDEYSVEEVAGWYDTEAEAISVMER